MSKVTDQEVLEVLRDPGYKSDSARCIALNITPNGGIYKRFKRLRAEHGIPEKEKKKKPDIKKPSKITFPKETKVGAAAEMLKFEDIKKDDRLTRNGKRLIVVAIDDSAMTLQRMDCSVFTLTRTQFNNTEGYSKVPAGDPRGGPVTTYRIDPASFGKDSAIPFAKIIDPPCPGGGGAGPVVVPAGGDGKPLFKEEDYIDPDWGFVPVVLDPSPAMPGKMTLGDLIDQIECHVRKVADKDLAALEEMRRRYA